MSENVIHHKCCRLAYLLSEKKIADVFKVHGDIDYWSNPGLDTDHLELEHGWLMKEPTIPCDRLKPEGCQLELEGKEKPWRCQNFPVEEGELHLIATCGFYFEDGVRKGACHGCKEIS